MHRPDRLVFNRGNRRTSEIPCRNSRASAGPDHTTYDEIAAVSSSVQYVYDNLGDTHPLPSLLSRHT